MSGKEEKEKTDRELAGFSGLSLAEEQEQPEEWELNDTALIQTESDKEKRKMGCSMQQISEQLAVLGLGSDSGSLSDLGGLSSLSDSLSQPPSARKTPAKPTQREAKRKSKADKTESSVAEVEMGEEGLEALDAELRGESDGTVATPRPLATVKTSGSRGSGSDRSSGSSGSGRKRKRDAQSEEGEMSYEELLGGTDEGRELDIQAEDMFGLPAVGVSDEPQAEDDSERKKRPVSPTKAEKRRAAFKAERKALANKHTITPPRSGGRRKLQRLSAAYECVSESFVAVCFIFSPFVSVVVTVTALMISRALPKRRMTGTVRNTATLRRKKKTQRQRLAKRTHSQRTQTQTVRHSRRQKRSRSRRTRVRQRHNRQRTSRRRRQFRAQKSRARQRRTATYRPQSCKHKH